MMEDDDIIGTQAVVRLSGEIEWILSIGLAWSQWLEYSSKFHRTCERCNRRYAIQVDGRYDHRCADGKHGVCGLPSEIRSFGEWET